MTITEVPPTAAPTPPISSTRKTLSPTPAPVSSAPAAVSPAGRWASFWAGRDRLKTGLSLIAAIGGTLVGAIGFAMSYSTLAKVAVSWGFSEELAPWFPIGIDASIVAFLAMDLVLIRQNTRWVVLRLAAHTMTAATIWFNAASQGSIADDPVKAASHAIMPFLFVIGVEAARHLVIKKARLESGTATDRIPLHRWFLEPLHTPQFYRRMRLHGVRSYPEMIRRDQDLRAYKQWLSRKYKGNLSEASDDELLPMEMAKYGYTVEQALALPEQQEQAAAERAEAAERRRRDAETRRALAEDQAATQKTQSAADRAAAQARAEGQKGEALAHSRAQVSAAERAAELEAQALDNAVIAEARAREAEAEHQEAQAREAAAAADLQAAELERQAAEKRKEAEQADLTAAAELQAIETEKIAKAKKAASEATRAAAEAAKEAEKDKLAAAEIERKAAEEIRLAQEAEADTEKAKLAASEAVKAAAEARLAAAEIEQAAVEAEDVAKLSRRQRGVRKVARMAQAAGLDTAHLTADETYEQLCALVSLADVQQAVDVSSTDSASKYRAEAAQFLTSGTN